MKTNRYWEAIAAYMNDDIREQVHAELAPCTAAITWNIVARRQKKEKEGRQTQATRQLQSRFLQRCLYGTGCKKWRQPIG